MIHQRDAHIIERDNKIAFDCSVFCVYITVLIECVIRYHVQLDLSVRTVQFEFVGVASSLLFGQ